MTKRVLITGSTDGIGLVAARDLLALGHRVVLHGRNPKKLADLAREFDEAGHEGQYETHEADLAVLAEVERFSEGLASQAEGLDVLINNAGVFTAPEPRTADGLDVRFAVNTIAPYIITRRLLPKIGPDGRIVNLSSAAQSPVDARAFRGEVPVSAGAAYAQSKLALTAWTRALGLKLGGSPSVVSVNPGSLLGTKMVLEAFGSSNRSVQIGADILVRATVDEEFDGCEGEYFDNDVGRFGAPHPDVNDEGVRGEIEELIRSVVGSGD
ncbi:MAG: SDR family NAD(P)-dependent oxidoreductase [Gemmatimonadetes bacterium]|nr:SDR family NAD(P)-dependent oxidoreductase [Gemmatimonadota bacterium]